jgi:hypothetical protein
MNSNKQQIDLTNKYLSQESLAFRDWYKEYKTQETGIPGTEVSLANVDKIEKTFDDWFESSKEQLHQIICIEWNYPAKKNLPEIQESVSFVMALADFFITKHTHFPSPLALATLLFMRGLDNLCNVRS